MRRMLVSFLKGFNVLVRKFSAFTHYAQFAVQWYPKPRPEWFDHYLDPHRQSSIATSRRDRCLNTSVARKFSAGD